MQMQQQHTIDLNTLGGRIRAAREGRELRKVAVTNQIGISRPTLYTWENDTAQPDLASLIKFSKVVDVTLDWLADRRGPDPKFIKLK